MNKIPHLKQTKILITAKPSLQPKSQSPISIKKIREVPLYLNRSCVSGCPTSSPPRTGLHAAFFKNPSLTYRGGFSL